MEGMRNGNKILVINSKMKRKYLGDFNVDERIILQWILRKQV
jgi:hypothetical protein